MTITFAQLDEAFEGFVAKFSGDDLAHYRQSVRDAYYSDYRGRLRAGVEANGDFFRVLSRCSYLGYGSDQQLEVILTSDVAAPKLGAAVREACADSRTLMYRYFTGTVPQLDRDEGMALYARRCDQLIRQIAYKNKKALLKRMKHVYVDFQEAVGSYELMPSNHKKLEIWVGLGTGSTITVNHGCSDEELGQAVFLAIQRCLNSVN